MTDIRTIVRFLSATLVLLALLAFAARPAGATDYPVTLTDSHGRSVTIPARPKAILLGTGFHLVALSLVDPDPVSRLAGWSEDMKADNPELYARFAAKFPALDRLSRIDDGSGPGLSLETLLTIPADLAILANWQADTDAGKQAMTVLEQSGVPVLVLDFNSAPLDKTPEAMRLLGRAIDRERQADDFARLFEERIARIRERVARADTPGPSVLMDAFPNPGRCCYAYGTGGLGAFLTLAGGRNVAEGLPAPGGMVSAEFLLAANPEVYIATSAPAGGYSDVVIGPGVAEETARDSLKKAVSAPILAELAAVRSGRVHGLWNFFNAVPLNVVAAEAFATWLRPHLFPDLDPAATLREINDRFAAVPFDGAYWISLEQTR
ncbi:ferrichrome ABC transporter [Rhizobium rhizosphaerae]|uniref:Ferrichrome ABC transporter n=1 Tax=Xaviernesmea rhizosphaerae TaxID=1672749 RepID=A0A1Q9AM51_9HYPH|nr:ABC transporter substrate-binding protein [Xaviernesmea rhizosphaerae]OLP56490.1 ferrichrome ABC transporter [Xaviernesmea rhizosphaerae]